MSNESIREHPEAESEPVECKHKSSMSAAGIKVCFDCGEPLNAAARAIASMRVPRA